MEKGVEKLGSFARPPGAAHHPDVVIKRRDKPQVLGDVLLSDERHGDFAPCTDGDCGAEVSDSILNTSGVVSEEAVKDGRGTAS